MNLGFRAKYAMPHLYGRGHKARTVLFADALTVTRPRGTVLPDVALLDYPRVFDFMARRHEFVVSVSDNDLTSVARKNPTFTVDPWDLINPVFHRPANLTRGPDNPAPLILYGSGPHNSAFATEAATVLGSAVVIGSGHGLSQAELATHMHAADFIVVTSGMMMYEALASHQEVFIWAPPDRLPKVRAELERFAQVTGQDFAPNLIASADELRPGRRIWAPTELRFNPPEVAARRVWAAAAEYAARGGAS